MTSKNRERSAKRTARRRPTIVAIAARPEIGDLEYAISRSGQNRTKSILLGIGRRPHWETHAHGAGVDPVNPSSAGSRIEFSRQLLGLQQWRKRNPHGEGSSRWVPRKSIPDDQVRRAYQGIRCEANRR